MRRRRSDLLLILLLILLLHILFHIDRFSLAFSPTDALELLMLP